MNKEILSSLLNFCLLKDFNSGISLEVQWLGLHVSNAGSMDLIPGQGTKILCATRYSQEKKKKTLFQTQITNLRNERGHH